MPKIHRRVIVRCTCVLAILAAVQAFGQGGIDDREHGEPSLGAVSFPTSCAADLQHAFDRSVALLHHMTYQQALEGFEAIAERDPDCAIARWGIAMSLFQPLWPNRPGPEALHRGWDAIEEARRLGAPSERERLYIAAAAAFFREPNATDYWERIRRWERGQEALYRAFPEDLDATAFYALSILAAAPRGDNPLELHERAANLLLGVLRLEPTHPGAIHYTIHANDIAGREGESTEVVRRYAEIAPDNPHALHMPTHIFVRLGAWQEAIDWNRRAALAALAHPAGDFVSDEYPHAIEYLVYAELQLGEDGPARQAWNELRDTADLQPTFKTAFHLASIPARLALERRDWREAAALEPRRPSWIDWDRFPWPEAVTWFAKGLGSARLGDLETARRASSSLADLESTAIASGESPFASEIRILRLELDGWIAQGEGDSAAAEESLRSAVELAARTPKQPVTPAPILPARELLADLLLETGRPADALAAYEQTLREAPGRRNSLRGAESARASLE